MNIIAVGIGLIEAVQQSKNARKGKTNRALNPKRSDFFVVKINCGTASIDIFAKAKSIMFFVYVKFNRLRSGLTITLSTFSILPFRFKAISRLLFLLILDCLAAT